MRNIWAQRGLQGPPLTAPCQRSEKWRQALAVARSSIHVTEPMTNCLLSPSTSTRSTKAQLYRHKLSVPRQLNIFKRSSPGFAFSSAQIHTESDSPGMPCSDGSYPPPMSRTPGKLSLLVGICVKVQWKFPCIQKATLQNKQHLFQSLSSFSLHLVIVPTSR
jgi:hypothetical protein